MVLEQRSEIFAYAFGALLFAGLVEFIDSSRIDGGEWRVIVCGGGAN